MTENPGFLPGFRIFPDYFLIQTCGISCRFWKTKHFKNLLRIVGGDSKDTNLFSNTHNFGNLYFNVCYIAKSQLHIIATDLENLKSNLGVPIANYGLCFYHSIPGMKFSLFYALTIQKIAISYFMYFFELPRIFAIDFACAGHLVDHLLRSIKSFVCAFFWTFFCSSRSCSNGAQKCRQKSVTICASHIQASSR